MSIPGLNTSLKYSVQITGVRELALLGVADLAFWKQRLHQDELHPTNVDGRAQVLISVADSKYRGIPFKELSISVFVCRHADGAEQDGIYLARAFNTSRFFAFVERSVFHSPYVHGKIQVDTRLPASFQLSRAEEVLLNAEMSPGNALSHRAPARSGADGWEGPIFLPGDRPGRDDQGWLFFGKIGGETQTYPFSTSGDLVDLRPSPREPILDLLIASHFIGKEWIIRGNATHAKSKTLRRSPDVWARETPPAPSVLRDLDG